MNHHFCILTGVYALRPELPAIPGGEGVGVVTAVGSHVTSLKTGDWVIPALPSLGEYLYIVTIFFIICFSCYRVVAYKGGG